MEKQLNTDQQELPNIHSEHLKEEFYKWFESRGLLSDLRAYMRQLMVKALEDSNKNGKNQKQRKSISPKLQAINLIVIDYLFHEDYLYTVSVFASEAQFLDSLPQYSNYITQTVKEQRWDPRTMPRFSQVETADILDTLRMPPSQRERQDTTNMYLSSNNSLLTCIVRSFASSVTEPEPSLEDWRGEQEVECEKENTHQLWSKEMQNLLLLAGVKLQHIRRMQQKWAQLMKEEKENAKKEAEEELSVQQTEIEQKVRAELAEQLRAEQQKLVERKSRVELRERGLASLAEQLTAVHDDINERLSNIQIQSEELRIREARQQSDRLDLEQRLSQLHLREEQLQMLYPNFQDKIEEASIGLEENSSLQKNADQTCTQPNLLVVDVGVQTEVKEHEAGVCISTQTPELVTANFTQTVDTADVEQQTSHVSEVDPQLILQLHTDRDRINELQEENLELRAHTLQQRQRITELTNRAASLSSQLEESQIAITVLSGQDSAVVSAPSSLGVWGTQPPPLPSTVITPTFGYNTPQRQGAGEENLFAARPQQTLPRQDARRRPVRFAFSQNPSPTSEDTPSSPTDEAIQSARARIHQLEQESAVVQRNFQDFQNRLLLTDSVIFPPLGAPRNRSPLIRVRRSDVLPFTPYPSFRHSNQPLQTSHTQTLHPVDHEELSSDQASINERNRIESMVNSRRMYTQRNMRQFERWKQFKKKFYRHDAAHSRRINLAAVSLTSSEDDESDVKRTRKKRELSKTKKSNDSSATDLFKSNLEDFKSKNNSKSKNCLLTLADSNTVVKDSTENNDLLNTGLPQSDISRSNIPVNPTQDSFSTKKVVDQNNLCLDQAKLRLEVERTEQLIKSVKDLLADQNKNQNSTLSDGSCQLDSLPKDSQKNSLMELNTDNSSVLTIQKAIPSTEKGNEEIHAVKESNINTAYSSSVEKIASLNIPNLDNSLEKKESAQSTNDLHFFKDDGKVLNLKQINPEPLSVPTQRLGSPGLQHVNSVDTITTGAVHAVDVAEQESSDRGTASVTSGSDIIRELNPSKTGSSGSVMSGGWAEHSKHSSDFWD